MAKEKRVHTESGIRELLERKKAGSYSVQGVKESKGLAAELSALLADSYMLYLKTQNFHWNVTGPHFGQLHTLFEQQYTDLTAAIDEAAERIRALGHVAPGRFSFFANTSSIEEAPDSPPSAMEMIRSLAADQSIIATACKRVISAAEKIGDEASQDFAVQRLRVHEKNAWMLGSMLEG